MSPAANRDFAGYRISRPLELGDRASVWEATDLESGRDVTIETLAGEAASDPDVCEWFTEAWRAVASLEHSRIVRVEKVDEQEGVPFAVRTPAGGLTLAKRLAVRGPLEPEDAVTLLAQIGGALDAAHGAGIVHGTLGPDCVLIEDGGAVPNAHLTGFGRAEGYRREDIEDLGSILAAMLGDDGGEGKGTAGLREVVSRSRDGGYDSASDLVAAAIQASAEDDVATDDETQVATSRSPRSGAGRWAAALVVLIAAAIAVAILVKDPADGPSSDEAGSGNDVAGGTNGGESSTAEPERPPKPDNVALTIDVPGYPVGVSARDGVVYAVSRDSGELSGYDQEDGKLLIGPVDLGSAARDVTIIDGVAWVTLPAADQVARVDLSLEKPRAEKIEVGSTPGGLIGAIGSVWVVDEGSGELSRIPLDGDSAESVPLEAADPRGIAYGVGSLWVTDAGGTVTRIDPRAPTTGEPTAVGGDPAGVLVVGDQVWVANSGDGTVTEIDPTSGKTSEVEVGGSPTELAADPQHLWVSNDAGYVSSVGLGSHDVVGVDLSGTAGSPQGIAVDQQVWTATGAGDSLIAVSAGG
ncbi:MAG: hypothetical protein H0V25_02550 [Solirubrobacterales bacterium]|nr:hypothetical protein [Solirubrobacterales bacterium]